MVKTSTKAAIGVAMYAASTVAGFAEDVKKSFEYLGKTYSLSEKDTPSLYGAPKRGEPIITRKDNSELIYRQDDNGNWFYDKNANNLKDDDENYMSNNFGIRAKRAKDLEKLAEFEYQSNRPDENKGKTFEYELWSDGTISQKDKPSVTFSQNWRYDTKDKGIMTWMHNKFNEKANGQIKDAFGSLINEYNALHDENKKLEGEKQKLTDIIKYHTDGKGDVALVTDVLMGDGFGYAGIGASYTLSDKLALTGTILAGRAEDKILETKTTNPSPMGIYGQATREQIGLEKLGVSGELALNLGKGFDFLLGGGVICDKSDEKTTEALLKDSVVLNEITSSEAQSETSGFFRMGLEKHLGNSGFGIRGLADVNLTDKTWAFGLGGSYSFHRPQNRGGK